MKMRKLLAWLLIFVMAFSGLVLASCGDDDDDTDADVPEEDLSPAFDGDVKTYKGKFNILTKVDGTATQYNNVHDIVAEDNLGDEAIKKVVRERNQLIKDNFGVEIVRKKEQDVKGVASTAISGKSTTYDAFRFTVRDSLNTALKGGMLDLVNDAPYLDLELDWWDQGIKENLMLANGAYIAIGDLMTGDKDSTFITLFNEKLIADKGNGNITPDKLYAEVMEGVGKPGGLTMAKLMTYAQDFQSGVDANSKLFLEANQTKPGNYGLYTQTQLADVILVGGGFTSTKKDDGEVSGLKSNVTPEFEAAVHEVWNHFGKYSNDAWFVNLNLHTGGDGGFWDKCARGSFKANKAAFYMTHAGTIDLIRDMEADYGVLPIPKLYDSQTEYASTLQYENCACISIPNRKGKNYNEKSSYIIEAMCYYSSQEYAGDKSLNYNYYNRVMKAKGVRDENAWKIIDLIFSNRVYDLGFAININGIADAVRSAAAGNNATSFSRANFNNFGVHINDKLKTLLTENN